MVSECANPAGFENRYGFASGMFGSDNEWTIEVDCFEPTMFLDVQFGRFGQSIKAQAVFIGVDDVEQFAFERFELHGVDSAFEDGLLHALADRLAGTRHSTKSSATFFGFSDHVVADDEEHEI